MAACVVASEINWGMVIGWAALAALVIFVCAMVAAELAEQRGRDPIAGAVLGVLFGPVAWLMISMIGRRRS